MICIRCKVTPRPNPDSVDIRDESVVYDIEYCNVHNSVYALETAKLIAERPRIQDAMAGDISTDVNGREIAADIHKLIDAIKQGVQLDNMVKEFIFIVTGSYDYEGATVLLGFSDRTKAESAIVDLKEHGWEFDKREISTSPLTPDNKLPTTLSQQVFDNYKVIEVRIT